MKSIYLVLLFLISVATLKSQNTNEPVLYSSLSIDSNKITFICDEVLFQKSLREPGKYEYRYNAYSGLNEPVYVPGHYKGSRSYTQKYYSFQFGYNETESLGFLFKNIEPHLNKYEVSNIEFNRAKKYAMKNLYSVSVSIIGYCILLNSTLKLVRGENNFGQPKELILNYGIPTFLIGGSFLFSRNFNKNKMKHLENAVNFYNDELIKTYNEKFNKPDEPPVSGEPDNPNK